MRNANARSDQPAMRLGSPQDVIAAVPYLLGFHPEDSLVAVAAGGPERTCAMRLDLPPDEHVGEAAAHLAGLLAANRFQQVVLVGYGALERVTPIVMAAHAALGAAGVELLEALRVDGGRFWSYFCAGDECCPPEGIAFDVDFSPIVAQAVVDGKVALAGRGELERSAAPVGGMARRSMRQATDRAEARFLRWVRQEPDAVDLRRRMVREGLPYVQGLIERGNKLTDDEVAWLGVLLTHLRVRDEAWVRTDADQLELWRDVLRRIEEPYAAGPACLMAYAAYLSGDGALANVALDRAVASDPGYSMAGLLRDVMLAGVPPSKARLRMTPEALAEAWDDTYPEIGRAAC